MVNRRVVLLGSVLLVFVALAICLPALWLFTRGKRVTMVTRVYEAQDVSKVILRAAKADTASIETDPQSTVVEVSGNPAGGAKGYHPVDPFWRETPAQDWGLDFVSARHGDVLIISSKNEIHYIHHHYFLRDLRVRVPRGIEA
jgi:hypothetical protein